MSFMEDRVPFLCGVCGSHFEPLNTDKHGNVISWSHEKKDCPWSEFEGLNKEQIMSIGLNAVINPFATMRNENATWFVRHLFENKVSFSEITPSLHQYSEDNQKG